MTLPDSLSSSFRANTSSNYSDGSADTAKNSSSTDPISSYQPPASAPKSSPIKPKSKWKMWVGGLVMLILVVGGAAGYYLFTQGADIRQLAYEDASCTPGTIQGVCGGVTSLGTRCLTTQRPYCDSTGTKSVCTNATACGYGTPENQSCGAVPHGGHFCNNNSVWVCNNGQTSQQQICSYGCENNACKPAPPPPQPPSSCGQYPHNSNFCEGNVVKHCDNGNVSTVANCSSTQRCSGGTCLNNTVSCWTLNNDKTACLGPVNVTGTTCPDGHYANEDTCLANATGTGGDTAKQEGETCNATAECATGLACSAGVCKDISPNKPDGATCTSTSECQTGSACSAGICKDISPLKPEGDTCSSTAECRTGLACSAGTCKDIGQDKPIGALCVSNSQCQSGVCSEGKCQVSNNGTDDTGGDDNIPTNNLCLDGSGQTIIRSDVYTCPNGDTNGDGQCTSGDSGYTYATHPGVYTTEPTGVGDCWQIDYYSVDLATSQQRWGANPNDPAGYCGHAGHPELCQTTSTPPPGPIGPMCLNIKLNNVTTADAAPQLGDEITFTCGTVAGVTNYQFRVRTPAGQVQEVQASAAGSNTSQTVTIDTAGTYYAQCQVCNANGCSGWENLPSN